MKSDSTIKCLSCGWDGQPHEAEKRMVKSSACQVDIDVQECCPMCLSPDVIPIVKDKVNN